MPRAKKQRLTRRKDGRFVLRYDGKWFYSSPWAKDERECFEQKEAYKKARDAGRLLAGHQTFKEYTGTWLPIHKAGVGDSTYNQYAAILDRVIKKIGHLYLDQITADDITALYASFKGSSASYLAKVKNLTRAIFDSAIAARLTYYNPCRDPSVHSPKGSKGSHRTITEEERNLIHTTPHKFRILAMIMLYSGMRPEEARGLNISEDVDFERKVIYVRRTVTWFQNKPIIGEGKNAFAEREIILLPILEEALTGLEGYLCCDKEGNFITASAYDRAWDSYVTTLEKKLNNFPSGKRWYGHTKAHKELAAKAAALRKQGKKEEAKKYDLPPWKPVTLRAYDLRHSFCTMCRDAGIEIHVCMKWMGHSSEKMILQIYDHVTDYREKLNAEILMKLKLGSQNSSQKADDEE